MDLFLGVDVGSVSTNVVALDKDLNVVFERYIRANGQPIESVKKGFTELGKEIEGKDFTVRSVGATGSGRQMASILIGVDMVKNEITAHATATAHYYPDVHTIFEIGGQDSKIIILQDGMVVDFSMNTVCAAGTGSFLDHQSERLGVPIEKFGELAVSTDKQVRIAGRCTVFAESDMIAKQQFGFSKAEIIKGLCDALVRNYINNLGRGKQLKPPFVFQGGVAANIGIVRAFEQEVNHKVIVPQNFGIMGAIGSAMLGKEYIERTGEKTKFRGFNFLDLNFSPTSFECGGCSNVCEVIRVDMDGKTVAMWGDKCGKWSSSV